MSGYVAWMAAEAEEGDPAENGLTVEGMEAEETPASESSQEGGWQTPLAHNLPGEMATSPEDLQETALDRNPEIWMYRNRTTALLRRYMRLSIETGRLPSVIGREVFRAKITAYTATTFEDRVIFVHDVEGCLERLDPFDQKIIARIVLQEYDHDRAARILNCARKTIERRLPDLLDEVSEEFLRVRLLVARVESKKEAR
jgi:hypothetical protein